MVIKILRDFLQTLHGNVWISVVDKAPLHAESMALGSNSADNNSMWPRLASRGDHDRFYTGQDSTVTRYRPLVAT